MHKFLISPDRLKLFAAGFGLVMLGIYAIVRRVRADCKPNL